VGVLEDRIAQVIAEIPAGGSDDFAVAVEGGIAADEIETRIFDCGGGRRPFTRITRIITDGIRKGIYRRKRR
jgi:hypothetical protein